MKLLLKCRHPCNIIHDAVKLKASKLTSPALSNSSSEQPAQSGWALKAASILLRKSWTAALSLSGLGGLFENDTIKLPQAKCPTQILINDLTTYMCKLCAHVSHLSYQFTIYGSAETRKLNKARHRPRGADLQAILTMQNPKQCCSVLESKQIKPLSNK